ncbi:hypothetical protein CICLE_v10017728mg, partial [Citrus x clementina]
MCSSCGDVKNISYPFRLKGNPAGYSNPESELSCESNKTILELNSGNYYVKRISYDESTISAADVNLANGSCSLPKSLERVDSLEKFLHNQQSWMPKRYSYPEIIAMTNHFTHKLGQGGFGSVYKGQLHTGGLIAVKMLENSKFSAEEFINEVSTIGRIHHVNVVQLLVFCSEGSKLGGDLELRNVTEIESMIARKLCMIGLWCIQ